MKALYLIIVFSLACWSCNSDAKKENLDLLSANDTASSPDNSSALADNAPVDIAEAVDGKEKVREFEKKLEPVIENARRLLPDAKKRFLKGLMKGESFYLTINLKEGSVIERVFVRVTKWAGENISGNIANDIAVLLTYKNGQAINFTESDVLDWTISKADGSEDGNFIGKFIEQNR